MFAWIVLLLVAILASGCKRASPSPTTPQTEAKDPVRIAILRDITGSFHGAIVPLRTSDVDPLLALVVGRGGALAFGLIDEMSAEPLLRVDIPARPEPSEPPPEPRAVNRIRYRILEARYREQILIPLEAQRQNWTELAHARADEFRSRLQTVFAEQERARATDLWGAVARADVMLNEEPGVRFLVALTDGRDTVRRFSSYAVTNDINVLVVNRSRDAGELTAFNPKVFENFASAVDHILTETGE